MAALTKDRNTQVKRRTDTFLLPVAAGITIHAGSMVSVNAAGDAISAADVAATIVAGRAEEKVDNSAGAAGDLSIKVSKGVFRYATSGANPVTKANHLAQVFVLDDQTVVAALGATNDIPAGILYELEDASNVWIAIL